MPAILDHGKIMQLVAARLATALAGQPLTLLMPGDDEPVQGSATAQVLLRLLAVDVAPLPSMRDELSTALGTIVVTLEAMSPPSVTVQSFGAVSEAASLGAKALCQRTLLESGTQIDFEPTPQYVPGKAADSSGQRRLLTCAVIVAGTVLRDGGASSDTMAQLMPR